MMANESARSDWHRAYRCMRIASKATTFNMPYLNNVRQEFGLYWLMSVRANAALLTRDGKDWYERPLALRLSFRRSNGLKPYPRRVRLP